MFVVVLQGTIFYWYMYLTDVSSNLTHVTSELE